MFLKKTCLVIAATVLTVIPTKLAQAASLYSATQLPGSINTMYWLAWGGGTYMQEAFDINNSGQVSYQTWSIYTTGVRNDNFGTWSYLWNQNLGSSLLREGQRTEITQAMWNSFWNPETYTQLLLGQTENFTEDQKAAAYNFLIGNIPISGATTTLAYRSINRSMSYVWNEENGAYFLGHGEVTGISESGWATFNNYLGGSYAYNINTQENFAIPTGSEDSRWTFTAINDQDEVAITNDRNQYVLDLSSSDVNFLYSGLNWDDGDDGLRTWNALYGDLSHSDPNFQPLSFCNYFGDYSRSRPCGYDMNQLGQVVGTTGTTASSAFLWENGEFYNLADLIPDWDGGSLVAATAINDKGQILAIASSGSSLSKMYNADLGSFAMGAQGRIYLLNPISEEDPNKIPEPSSLLGLFTLGLLGIFRKISRKR